MKPEIRKLNNKYIEVIGHYDSEVLCAKLTLLSDLYAIEHREGYALFNIEDKDKLELINNTLEFPDIPGPIAPSYSITLYNYSGTNSLAYYEYATGNSASITVNANNTISIDSNTYTVTGGTLLGLAYASNSSSVDAEVGDTIVISTADNLYVVLESDIAPSVSASSFSEVSIVDHTNYITITVDGVSFDLDATELEIPYLTFTCDDYFYIEWHSPSLPGDGLVEWSTNKIQWDDFNETEYAESNIGPDNKYHIYFRGIGNTYITGVNSFSGFYIDAGGSSLYISGDIETLLDYKTVALGNHPTMANNAFQYLFTSNNTAAATINASNLTLGTSTSVLSSGCYDSMFAVCRDLTAAPALPATTLASNCYAYMFTGCTSLTTAPALPATTLASDCYSNMFTGCTSLTTAPALPATTLIGNCYGRMFFGCSNLTTIPALPATTLSQDCYRQMFRGCFKIKLSETQTGEYTQAYRIPTTGNGTIGTNSLQDMFFSTGGTFDGTPSINTTYYLSNTNTIV